MAIFLRVSCEVLACYLNSGLSGLATNWVRLATNGTNLGLLHTYMYITFSIFLFHDLKNPGFVLIGASLTHFWPKSNIPDSAELRGHLFVVHSAQGQGLQGTGQSVHDGVTQLDL